MVHSGHLPPTGFTPLDVFSFENPEPDFLLLTLPSSGFSFFSTTKSSSSLHLTGAGLDSVMHFPDFLMVQHAPAYRQNGSVPPHPQSIEQEQIGQVSTLLVIIGSVARMIGC